MTEREKRILFFIRLWQYKKGYSPSVRDIANKFGVIHQAITYAIVGLKKKGYLEVAEEKNWRHRTFLFPKGTTMPWGNDQLPDELFGHFRKADEKEMKKKFGIEEPPEPPKNRRIHDTFTNKPLITEEEILKDYEPIEEVEEVTELAPLESDNYETEQLEEEDNGNIKLEVL